MLSTEAMLGATAVMLTLYVMDAAAQQLPEVRGFRWIAGAAWSSDASAVEKAGWSVQFHKAT